MNQPSESPLHLTNSTQVKDRNAFIYQVQQQILPAWRPLPTLNSSIVLYLIIFVFFASLGVAMLIYDFNSRKEVFRYDHKCPTPSTCSITINVDSTIQGPVYFYYKLTNFKQNQRQYLKSKNDDQLRGKWVDINTAKSDCGDKTTNKEMGWSHAVDNTPLDPEQVAFPCGMMSYSMFNDTFSIDSIQISQSLISLPNIKNYFNNHNLSKQGINLHNEHFLVWMRPSVQSQFIKLWGIINQDLEPGAYKINIENNYNVLFSEKWIEISNSSIFGNKNSLLGIGYVAVGALSLVILIVFVAAKGKQKMKNASIYQ